MMLCLYVKSVLEFNVISRSNKSHAEGGRKSRLGHGRRSSEDGYSGDGSHHKRGIHEHHKRSRDVGGGQRRRSHEEHGHHGHHHHKKSKPDPDVELETFTTTGETMEMKTIWFSSFFLQIPALAWSAEY